jgi:hypothetical protein
LALAELVVFLGHIEALGEGDPSRLGFEIDGGPPCRRLQLKCVRTLSTAFSVAWALADAASVRADDCSGGKEAAIEQAKTPHSDTHVTTSPEKPSRQVEQQTNAAEAWGGQRAEQSPHSDTQAPEGAKGAK